MVLVRKNTFFLLKNHSYAEGKCLFFNVINNGLS